MKFRPWYFLVISKPTLFHFMIVPFSCVLWNRYSGIQVFPAQAVWTCRNFAHIVLLMWNCLPVIYLHFMRSHSQILFSSHFPHFHIGMFFGLPAVIRREVFLSCHNSRCCCSSAQQLVINETTQPPVKWFYLPNFWKLVFVCLCTYAFSNHLFSEIHF